MILIQNIFLKMMIIDIENNNRSLGEMVFKMVQSKIPLVTF